MARAENEQSVVDIMSRSSSQRAEISKWGVQREVDVWELFDAMAALRGINLSRYRKSLELQEAIRRARRSLAEVWDLMREIR